MLYNNSYNNGYIANLLEGGLYHKHFAKEKD